MLRVLTVVTVLAVIATALIVFLAYKGQHDCWDRAERGGATCGPL